MKNIDLNAVVTNQNKYHFAKSALDGFVGQVLQNENSDFVRIYVKAYSFIIGNYNQNDLLSLYDTYADYDKSNIRIIINNEQDLEFLKQFGGQIKTRYLFDSSFLDKNFLSDLITNSGDAHPIKQIITKEDFIKYTNFATPRFKIDGFPTYEDFKNLNIVAFIAEDNNKVIGAIGSGIIYKDGLEAQLFVNDDYRKKGLATNLSARFCLTLLNQNRTPYWDAANEISAKLALKLGFREILKYSILDQDLKLVKELIANKNQKDIIF